MAREPVTITETVYAQIPADWPVSLATVAHRRYERLDEAMDGLKIVNLPGDPWRVVRVDATYTLTEMEGDDGAE